MLPYFSLQPAVEELRGGTGQEVDGRSNGSAPNVTCTPCLVQLPYNIESGSGRRSAVEAIESPIAWLPPGYEPGTGDGVASAARQRDRFGLGTFWLEDATSGSRRRIAIAA
jgi:hypothetical protein